MNYRMMIYMLGWVLNFEAVFMVPSLAVGLLYRETESAALLLAILLCAFLGGLAVCRKPPRQKFYAREGFITVALAWFVLSIFGAFPFRISGCIPSMIDAVFETASGFTTTGASILSDVEALPRCMLFWRSFTHWIGGMGILVFVIAILPLAGGSNMYLMKAESPGPSVKKLVPKVKRTAIMLYMLYVALTLVELVLLLAGRMPLLDALTITFGTAGTGGFGIKNDSMASYSTYLQMVVTVFMILFGVNFNVYYLIYKKRFREILKNSEVFVYLAIIAVSIGLISINISGMYASAGTAVKDAAFQVGSIITTTGYSSADFDLWPAFSKSILVLLMFIGSCAGSTGGGIKVSRVMIMFKTVIKELDYIIHPNNVKKITMDGKQVEHTVLRSINVFVMAYLMVFVASVLLISLDNFDLTTNFTAVAATLNNIGPGLGGVGPMANFGSYSGFSKIVMTFDMIAGRLELFPVLILFSWRTWKK
ncbi:MAG TPA: TrkH family potassium uptake protein [Candidatus Merdiplasma excrementigallinarum]|uniref:TrkH family potassium uptake protein n=1 Tax=Candidatus Merdiplasma excrementigallinarum TaxID=2840864 RepID=A0A9D1T8B6_9FIRM|nr:TrkH family potassium uptake protein [Candidatus Merdiplasma excrementigallinarum]